MLDKSRHVAISNGLISAQVFPPGEGALYRGTRFDHAGVVMHITYRGQNYTDYWFDRFVTDPSDTSRRPAGTPDILLRRQRTGGGIRGSRF